MSATQSRPTPTQAAALHAVLAGILEAVEAGGPMGAPAGVMYAAMMAQGCTLTQFNSITGAMVRADLLTRDGDLFHLTDAGRARVRTLSAR